MEREGLKRKENMIKTYILKQVFIISDQCHIHDIKRRTRIKRSYLVD